MLENEIGECPFCGEGNLRYYEPIIEEEMVYPWKCEDCGAFGEETYKIVFIGHYNTHESKILKISEK